MLYIYIIIYLQSKRNKKYKAMKPKTDVLELFSSAQSRKTYLKISAPMVRYSKLEFRTLLRHNDVDMCFTPMIMADSFCRSDLARKNEFTTNEDDSPLIAQFAAKDSIEFLTAAQLIYPYADGIDLNCGCPQRWAITAGYGCAVLKQPELLYDMIRTVKRNLPAQFTVSVKLRLLQKDVGYKSTVDLCRTIEKCGASFISVHGRTPWEKTCEPVETAAFEYINQSVQIPVIANGDVRTIEDSERIFSQTGCLGIMAARGILANPTLFKGNSATPISCVADWVTLAQQAGDQITFQCFHHHLTFMTEKLMRRKQRVIFNNLTRKEDVLNFLNENLEIDFSKSNAGGVRLKDCIECTYDEHLYQMRRRDLISLSSTYTQSDDGKFFKEFVSSEAGDEDDTQLCYMGDKSLFDT